MITAIAESLAIKAWPELLKKVANWELAERKTMPSAQSGKCGK
jgi:hypothetical protein